MEKTVIFLAGLIIGIILMAVCVAANAADKKLDEAEKKIKAESNPVISDEFTIMNLKEQIAKVDRGETSIISCPKGYSIQKIGDKWVIYRH